MGKSVTTKFESYNWAYATIYMACEAKTEDYIEQYNLTVDKQYSDSALTLAPMEYWNSG